MGSMLPEQLRMIRIIQCGMLLSEVEQVRARASLLRFKPWAGRFPGAYLVSR
jgi:hypothetical protein